MQQDATIKKLYAGQNELLGHMPSTLAIFEITAE
jgi:hypothetical protein